jgi:4-hydroxybenzoate polyprenyltransferase
LLSAQSNDQPPVMTPSQPLPDAAPANWVDRLAPPAWRKWLKLGRFDRPTGIWLLMLPAWQGIALQAAERGAWPNLRLLALFALGAAVMRTAGCAFNDIVDRDLDAKVARTAARPVASGAISVRAAWVFVIACALAGLAILLTLNLMSLFLGVASLVLVAAYPFMKRLTWWPQAWLGLTFNWGVLLGYAAAQGGAAGISVLSLAGNAWASGVDLTVYASPLPAQALLLYAAGVAWTLGYDTIYAVQDLEDDALAGVKSSARRLGDRAPVAVGVFYAMSVALAVAAWREARLGDGFLPLAAVFAGQLCWQALSLRMNDPARALRLFRSNTLAGALLAAAIVAGGLV